MRRPTVALACVAALVASGCGGDDEESTARDAAPPIPTVPEPATDTQTDLETESPAPVEPAPEPPPVEEPSGGAPAPAPTPVPDSPDNDVPPPEGSPAERFEQFCADNPGACG